MMQSRAGTLLYGSVSHLPKTSNATQAPKTSKSLALWDQAFNHRDDLLSLYLEALGITDKS
jgi:hypothetical protein